MPTLIIYLLILTSVSSLILCVWLFSFPGYRLHFLDFFFCIQYKLWFYPWQSRCYLVKSLECVILLNVLNFVTAGTARHFTPYSSVVSHSQWLVSVSSAYMDHCSVWALFPYVTLWKGFQGTKLMFMWHLPELLGCKGTALCDLLSSAGKQLLCIFFQFYSLYIFIVGV